MRQSARIALEMCKQNSKMAHYTRRAPLFQGARARPSARRRRSFKAREKKNDCGFVLSTIIKKKIIQTAAFPRILRQ